MPIKAIQVGRGVLATLLALCAALTASTSVAVAAPALESGAGAPQGLAPIVRIADGTVRGLATTSGGYEFLGLPYAVPPTRN